jgi:hypothetical protein
VSKSRHPKPTNSRTIFFQTVTIAKYGILALIAASIVAVLACFPWHLDLQRDDTGKTRAYYEKTRGKKFHLACLRVGLRN